MYLKIIKFILIILILIFFGLILNHTLKTNNFSNINYELFKLDDSDYDDFQTYEKTDETNNNEKTHVNEQKIEKFQLRPGDTFKIKRTNEKKKKILKENLHFFSDEKFSNLCIKIKQSESSNSESSPLKLIDKDRNKIDIFPEYGKSSNLQDKCLDNILFNNNTSNTPSARYLCPYLTKDSLFLTPNPCKDNTYSILKENNILYAMNGVSKKKFGLYIENEDTIQKCPNNGEFLGTADITTELENDSYDKKSFNICEHIPQAGIYRKGYEDDDNYVSYEGDRGDGTGIINHNIQIYYIKKNNVFNESTRKIYIEGPLTYEKIGNTFNYKWKLQPNLELQPYRRKMGYYTSHQKPSPRSIRQNGFTPEQVQERYRGEHKLATSFYVNNDYKNLYTINYNIVDDVDVTDGTPFTPGYLPKIRITTPNFTEPDYIPEVKNMPDEDLPLPFSKNDIVFDFIDDNGRPILINSFNMIIRDEQNELYIKKKFQRLKIFIKNNYNETGIYDNKNSTEPYVNTGFDNDLTKQKFSNFKYDTYYLVCTTMTENDNTQKDRQSTSVSDKFPYKWKIIKNPYLASKNNHGKKPTKDDYKNYSIEDNNWFVECEWQSKFFDIKSSNGGGYPINFSVDEEYIYLLVNTEENSATSVKPSNGKTNTILQPSFLHYLPEFALDNGNKIALEGGLHMNGEIEYDSYVYGQTIYRYSLNEKFGFEQRELWKENPPSNPNALSNNDTVREFEGKYSNFWLNISNNEWEELYVQDTIKKFPDMYSSWQYVDEKLNILSISLDRKFIYGLDDQNRIFILDKLTKRGSRKARDTITESDNRQWAQILGTKNLNEDWDHEMAKIFIFHKSSNDNSDYCNPENFQEYNSKSLSTNLRSGYYRAAGDSRSPAANFESEKRTGSYNTKYKELDNLQLKEYGHYCNYDCKPGYEGFNCNKIFCENVKAYDNKYTSYQVNCNSLQTLKPILNLGDDCECECNADLEQKGKFLSFILRLPYSNCDEIDDITTGELQTVSPSPIQDVKKELKSPFQTFTLNGNDKSVDTSINFNLPLTIQFYSLMTVLNHSDIIDNKIDLVPKDEFDTEKVQNSVIKITFIPDEEFNFSSKTTQPQRTISLEIKETEGTDGTEGTKANEMSDIFTKELTGWENIGAKSVLKKINSVDYHKTAYQPKYDINTDIEYFDHLHDIGINAFKNFSGIISLTDNNGIIKSLGSGCFDMSNLNTPSTNTNNKLSKIVLKNVNLIDIPKNCFSKFKGIIHIEGPFKKLKNIGQNAFKNADNSENILNFEDAPLLEKIGIGSFTESGGVKFSGNYDNLTSIGEDAFNDLKSGNIILQNCPKLSTIGDRAFMECENIDISFKGEYPELSIINDSVFKDSGTSLSEINFKNNVQEFKQNCFENYKGSITIIGSKILTKIGNLSFSECVNKNNSVVIENRENELNEDNFLLQEIAEDAFEDYKGILKIAGFFPSFKGDKKTPSPFQKLDKSSICINDNSYEQLKSLLDDPTENPYSLTYNGSNPNNYCLEFNTVNLGSSNDDYSFNSFGNSYSNPLQIELSSKILEELREKIDDKKKNLETLDETDENYKTLQNEINELEKRLNSLKKALTFTHIKSESYKRVQESRVFEGAIFSNITIIEKDAFKNFVGNFIFFLGHFGKLAFIYNSAFKGLRNVYFLSNNTLLKNINQYKDNLANYPELKLIDDFAFSECENVYMFLRCNNLRRIGEGAFQNIKNLQLHLELNSFDIFIINGGANTKKFLEIFKGSSGYANFIVRFNIYEEPTDVLKKIGETARNIIPDMKINICFSGECDPKLKKDHNNLVDYHTDEETVKINSCGTCNFESTFITI